MDIPLDRMDASPIKSSKVSFNSEQKPKKTFISDRYSVPENYGSQILVLKKTLNYTRTFEVFVNLEEEIGLPHKFTVEVSEKRSDCHTVISQIIRTVNKYLALNEFSFALKDIPIYYEMMPASKNGIPKKNSKIFDFKDSIWGIEKLFIKFHKDAILKTEVKKKPSLLTQSNDQINNSFNTTDSELSNVNNNNRNTNSDFEFRRKHSDKVTNYLTTKTHYSSFTFLSDKKQNSSDQLQLDTSNFSNESILTQNQLYQIKKQKEIEEYNNNKITNLDDLQHDKLKRNIKSYQQKKKKRGFFSMLFCCNTN